MAGQSKGGQWWKASKQSNTHLEILVGCVWHISRIVRCCWWPLRLVPTQLFGVNLEDFSICPACIHWREYLSQSAIPLGNLGNQRCKSRIYIFLAFRSDRVFHHHLRRHRIREGRMIEYRLGHAPCLTAQFGDSDGFPQRAPQQRSKGEQNG